MKLLHAIIVAGSALAIGCVTPTETGLAKRTAGGPSDKGPRLIQAGPMIGHVGPSEAKVWVRTKRGSTLTATAAQGSKGRNRLSVEDLGNGFSVLQFSRLAPAVDTKVVLTVERAGSAPETAEVAFNTAAAPSDTGRVRIAFGSCSKVSQFNSGPIYKAIAEERPDMALFVGDNSYFIVADGSDRHFHTTGPTGDWSSPEAMTARHLTTRMHPDLQAMFRAVPCYAVWDDHDYGPDNADRTFDLREVKSLRFGRLVDRTAPEWSIFLEVEKHTVILDTDAPRDSRLDSEEERDAWLAIWANGAPPPPGPPAAPAPPPANPYGSVTR